MTAAIRIAGAQLALTVGDLDGNEARVLDAMRWAEGAGADVLLLPELATTGYPPEDLVLRPVFVSDNLAVLRRLAAASGSTAVVVGFVDRLPQGRADDDSMERHVTNSAAILAAGSIAGVYHKVLLPNYGVFDEARYFAEGDGEVTLWSIAGIRCGVSICEDIWSLDGPPSDQAGLGAQILLNINGSPYHIGKGAERAELLRRQAMHSGVPVVYLNTVGGQDELVFDGDSMVLSADGEMLYRAAQFREERFLVDVPVPERGPAAGPVTEVTPPGSGQRYALVSHPIEPRLDEAAEVYTALVTGLRDYVTKNGFDHVVVGLSGGIDSSLTAAIAVDALGAEHVLGVTMPTRYSSEGSVADSRKLAENLGCRFVDVPIERIFGEFLETLRPLFAGTSANVAEENLQARIRGAVLMALSNKFGGMVVATGNKSEMGVGYSTLYGDMVGGFAVLKDVYKTLVYRLAAWRNALGEVIPQSVIDKEPSAELRADQRDSDTLPPYPLLDDILYRYVELDRAPGEITAEGFDQATVERVAAMVDRNEYKRRQAAPGVKITRKAFGRDRRLPITNHTRNQRPSPPA